MGCLGSTKEEATIRGKKRTFKKIKRKKEIFTFTKLTKSGAPVHPLCRRRKQEISKEGKRYI